MKERKRSKKETGERDLLRKGIVGVTYFFVVLFLVMMGYIVYFNAVKSEDFINSP